MWSRNPARGGAQVETALVNAERQIERLRAREAVHGSALAETRRALRATRDDAASSAVSEETGETGSATLPVHTYCRKCSGDWLVIVIRA